MQGEQFKARQSDCFTFSSHAYDPVSGIATLSYSVDGRFLQEKVTFPWAPWPVDASRQAAFFKALELLHLVAGISYYKAGLARRIDMGECRVDPALAGFLNEFYLEGLGEFAYVNQLDLSGVINFEANSREESVLPGETRQVQSILSLDLPERALVAMGGGKDSLVCLQMLRNAGIEVQPACVGGSDLIGETAKAAGLPLIRVQRQLAPDLSAMNADGAWNGHVPVTAINSAILLCAALLYGYRHIVFANESSANEATLKDDRGRDINHQYSKSISFEKSFRKIIRQRICADVEYFSLLRPFSEIAITRQFAKMPEFHHVFSSCNRNFHLDGPRIEGRWCRDCPKCRFAALALAIFMPPEHLIEIQGKDLLDDEKQLDGFKALCGLEKHKPFECVGSIAESRAAMRYLSRSPQWQGRRVVQLLAEFEEIRDSGELVLDPDPESEHCIPEAIAAELNAV